MIVVSTDCSNEESDSKNGDKLFSVPIHEQHMWEAAIGSYGFPNSENDAGQNRCFYVYRGF